MKKRKITAAIIVVTLAASITIMPPKANAGDDMRWIDWSMDYLMSAIAFANCGLAGLIGSPMTAGVSGIFCHSCSIPGSYASIWPEALKPFLRPLKNNGF